MGENELWTKEEFEEHITRAMVAVYDYNWNFEFPERYLRPSKRFTEVDWHFIKSKGVYFPARDRLFDSGGVDLRNDGLPKFALLTVAGNDKQFDGDFIGDYLRIFAVKKIDKIKPPYLSTAIGVAKYLFYQVCVRPEGGCVYGKHPVIITSTGEVVPCHEMVWDGFRDVRENVQKSDPHEYNNITSGTSIAISGWQDRLNTWNVEVTDNAQKCLFGVYQEEVKSLFYSRNEPITGTGRLRPILHWVKAHRRRIKSGIDIDIEKHLRGTDQFVMDGYQFSIIRPTKRPASGDMPC